jgi:hypothetical protein
MKPQQSFGVSLVPQMEAFLKHNREITIHGTPMGIWAAALPQYFKNHHTLYKAHQIQRWGIEMENNLDDETPVPDRKEMAWTGLLSGALILIVFNIEGLSSWGNSTLIEDFIREIYGSSYSPPDKEDGAGNRNQRRSRRDLLVWQGEDRFHYLRFRQMVRREGLTTEGGSIPLRIKSRP